LYSEQAIWGKKIVTCGFGDLLCTGHVILRKRSKLGSFHNGKTLFFAYKIKIGMWVRHEKHCTWHSQGQKVKVTRSCDVVAQKHRIYPVTVTR